MKGKIFKGNRIKTLQLRVDLLVCLLKSKQRKFSYTVDFSKLSKRQYFVYIQTGVITKLTFFSKHLSKDKQSILYTSTHGSLQNSNYKSIWEPHMSNFRAIEKIIDQHLS